MVNKNKRAVRPYAFRERKVVRPRRMHEAEEKVFEVTADVVVAGTYYVAAENEEEAKEKLRVVLGQSTKTLEDRELSNKYPYFFMNNLLRNPYGFYSYLADDAYMEVNDEADMDASEADIR